MDDVGYRRFVEFKSVDVTEGLHDLVVNLRKRIEQRKPEVAQAHADFVIHGGLGEAYFVGLPERSNFGANVVLAVFGFLSA